MVLIFMEKCVCKITKVWDMLQLITISISWKMIHTCIKINQCFDEETISMADLAAILKHADGYENINTENSEQWSEVHTTVMIMR